MKKILILLAFILAPIVQIMADEVYISVAMQANSILDSNAKTILKNKIVSMVTSNGIAATEYSAIAVVPEISVMQKDKVEGGMRTITSMEINITLTVRNVVTGNVFNSVQISAKGNGYSEADAIKNAIRTTDISDSRYGAFISEAKRRIVEYYKTNTNMLITKANTLASQQQYDEAIALLDTYPEFLSDYNRVASTIKSIFKQSQTKYCSEILQSARAAYARRDYDEAAEIASCIDITSSCGAEAKSLLASIKRGNDQVYNDEISYRNERMRAQERMATEKMKSQERITTATIRAARDVAKAYYGRQTNYVYIW